jgi:hypothetical protein
MATAYLVPFQAAVPRGHGVLVVVVELGEKNATMVLDRTTSSLYCQDELSDPLRQDPALAVTDPISLLRRSSWTVKLAVDGVCAGTITSTKGWSQRYGMSTCILVEPTSAPYR